MDSCVLTVSCDQTARLFTAVATAASGPGGHWCEIARPQVRGRQARCLLLQWKLVNALLLCPRNDCAMDRDLKWLC